MVDQKPVHNIPNWSIHWQCDLSVVGRAVRYTSVEDMSCDPRSPLSVWKGPMCNILILGQFLATLTPPSMAFEELMIVILHCPCSFFRCYIGPSAHSLRIGSVICVKDSRAGIALCRSIRCRGTRSEPENRFECEYKSGGLISGLSLSTLLPMGTEERVVICVPIYKLLQNRARKGNLPWAIGDTLSPFAELFWFYS